MIESTAMLKLTYGLFVLTAKDGDKDNGCIINTATQITMSPPRISIAVNKANFTHDMILKTKMFNLSILTENAPYQVFEQFGLQSGRDTDKFAGSDYNTRAENGLRYLPKYTNGVISAQTIDTFDYGTHTLFIADITQSFSLSSDSSMTYQYYFDNVKPKTPQNHKAGFVCKICGYIYEGSALPDDFICPLCKHDVKDFEPI
jgi:Conserved protein/domain typically associated with flavoprotein oxygenases, DIM6/NTAB family